MIISIVSSPIEHKRFRAFIKMKDGSIKHVDFALKNANTFLDTRTESERINYIKRHLKNPNENHLIHDLTVSPALLSFYITWGPYKSLQKNIDHLNKLWRIKHQSTLHS
jgi:hypothetical protein